MSLSLTQLCEGTAGIPFDSANSIWWKNKYTGGVGDEKRVGVLGGGREDKTEEMEGYIELREGMRRGGFGGGGWWGQTEEWEKEKRLGSGDE